jgi:hypothetical protein
MDRPIKRPDKLYTMSEILRMARQHFVYDKSPRCAADPTNPNSECKYSGSGCFIGFMFTKEDADCLPNVNIFALVKDFPHILSFYFDITNKKLIAWLLAGQMAHDRFNGGNQQYPFDRHMNRCLDHLEMIATQLELV